MVGDVHIPAGFIIFMASLWDICIWWVSIPCIWSTFTISLSLWLRTMNPHSHSAIFIGIFMCEVTDTPPRPVPVQVPPVSRPGVKKGMPIRSRPVPSGGTTAPEELKTRIRMRAIDALRAGRDDPGRPRD